MDTFEALIDEVSQSAQDGGLSFEDALLSVLSEDGAAVPDTDIADLPQAEDITEDDSAGTPDNGSPQLLTTLDHLIMTMMALVPVRVDAVLTQDSWVSSGNDETLYACRYTHEAFAAHKRADMYISMASSEAAAEAQLYPITDTQNGYVQIHAQAIPETDLAVTFVVSPVIEN